MKTLSHRTLYGASRFRNGPVDQLVVEGADLDGQQVVDLACRLQAAILDASVDAGHAEWDARGRWKLITPADDADVARLAAKQALHAVRDAGSAAPDEKAALKRLRRNVAALDPSRRALIAAAKARDIPVVERGHGLLQLGWGRQARRIWRSIPGDAPGLGFDILNDHERSKQVLAENGIPLPRFDSCSRLAGAEEVADEIGYPVAVKPLRGPGGVTAHVAGPSELEAAYDAAKERHRWLVIEEHVPGESHRLLVVGGTLLSAIRESDGADVTDTVHPSVRLAAERAVRLCQATTAAATYIAPTIDGPVDTGRFVQFDPRPDLVAAGHNAVGAVLDGTLEGNGRIPLITVTGTNGKTTTVRLIAHILKYSGGRVGMACTGAVEVENQVILRGDYSGPTAAQTVLREPGITHAVCEVARGGILRQGLGYDRCDVAVFLNVGSDHLGQGGIDSVEDLARLKSIVARSACPGGTVVLNADDPNVWAYRRPLEEAGARIIPISLAPDHPAIDEHLAADPENVFVVAEDGAIVVRRGTARFRVADILEIPVTLDGAAWFNIQNACAAVAATYAVGCTEEATRAGLITFNPTVGQLPGRMNLITLGGVKVLLDYGHNVPALQALASVLPRLARGRKINVANASGNRRDEDLMAFGRQIASMYDRVFVCDPDPRGRGHGETAKVIVKGLQDAGFPDDRLVVEMDEARALRRALAESRPGDLVVLQADDVQGAIDLCQALRLRLEAGESPADLNEELLSM